MKSLDLFAPGGFVCSAIALAPDVGELTELCAAFSGVVCAIVTLVNVAQKLINKIRKGSDDDDDAPKAE